MTDVATSPQPPGARQRAGRRAQAIAFGLLLCCLAARTYLPDLPFDVSHARLALSATQGATAEGTIDRTQFSRAVFAAATLAAMAVWLVGGALAGAIRVRWPLLAGLILAFGAWSLASGLRAGETRAGLLVWMEQFSFLAAAFGAAQFCADARRFKIVVVVLAALAVGLAAKGLWQVYAEIPDRVANFQAHRDECLAQIGYAPNTPEASMFEARLRDATPTGYLALANPFASMLIVLLGAVAGLTAGAVASGRKAKNKTQAEDRGQRENSAHSHGHPGVPVRPCHPDLSTPCHPAAQGMRKEIDPIILPVILGVIAVLAVAAVLLLTRSRGGIAAAGVSALVLLAVLGFGGLLRDHRRAALISAAAVLLMLCGTVVAWGLAHDSLPSKSLTYRWFYWSSGAKIVRDNPVWGVGGGNFPFAYLQYRRPEAEESVKLPHNFIVHAMTQFGVPGGLLFLAALAAMLVGITGRDPSPGHLVPAASGKFRPVEPGTHARTDMPDASPSHSDLRGDWPILLAVAVAVFAARLAMGGWTGGAWLVLDVVLPVFVLCIALAAAWWLAHGMRDVSLCRVILACGVLGFFLHGLVETGFAIPAPALLFWVALGACLGPMAGKEYEVRLLRWPLAIAAAAALAVCLNLNVIPMAIKCYWQEQAARRFVAGNPIAAAQAAIVAADTDPRDSLARLDAARYVLANCPHKEHVSADRLLDLAKFLCDGAAARSPRDLSPRQLAATVAMCRADYDQWIFRWPPPPSAGPLYKELADRLTGPEIESSSLNDLAGVACQQGNYDRAWSLCQWALAGLERDSTVLYAHMGEIAYRRGAIGYARAAWCKAAAVTPGPQETKEALDNMAAAVALDPMNHRLHAEYAVMLCWAGRGPDCLRQIDRALEIDRKIADFARRYAAAQPPVGGLRTLTPSTVNFSPWEIADLQMLQARAAAISPKDPPQP